MKICAEIFPEFEVLNPLDSSKAFILTYNPVQIGVLWWYTPSYLLLQSWIWYLKSLAVVFFRNDTSQPYRHQQ